MADKAKLVRQLTFILEKTGREWKIDGKLQTPSSSDVEKVLDTLYQAVYDGEEGMDAQMGGIRVSRSDGHYDVYVYLGEINDTD